MVVGTAGMLTEQKDHETLIRAVAAASTRLDTNLILVIAGDGDRRSDLEAMADSLDIRDSINFLGLLERNEVYAMLHEIDVYAMPSKWEGFSAAAVEALGSGTPCIFSDISAFTLPFRDVASFHEVGDSHELADRLVTLSRHPDRREKLGKAGRRLVAENYVIEEVSRGYADLYRKVVEQSE
jgi:glycosyltransferase involved in cell wall biosynthesis